VRPEEIPGVDGGGWRLRDASIDVRDAKGAFYEGRFTARAAPVGCDASAFETDLTGDFATTQELPGPWTCR